MHLISAADPAFITQGGVFAVALAIAYYLLKRSDEREQARDRRSQEELATERAAHDATRAALTEALLRLAECEKRNTRKRTKDTP